MEWQKGQTLIFLLVGVLIIATIAGAFYLGRSSTPKSSPNPQATSQTPSPTQDASHEPTSSAETANWKTYTNDKFSFKYPTEWYFMTAQENYGRDYKGASTEVLFSNKLKNGKIPSGIDVTRSTLRGIITISGCNYASDCEMWTTESNFYDTKSSLWQGKGGSYPIRKQVSLSELGGKRAVLIKSQADTDAEVYKGDYSIQYNVFLGDEHLTLTFGYNNQNQDNNQVLEKFKQILSTFKFTQ